jgi:hypothetical protein
MPELNIPSDVSPKKLRVVPSIIGGFILAFLGMGLPMIGVTENLWLGSSLLLAAFALFAWGTWSWETNRKFSCGLRLTTIALGGTIYFALLGLQVHSQFKKSHPATIGTVVGASPGGPRCDGPTGAANANGDGSIANSGNCVSRLSTDRKFN